MQASPRLTLPSRKQIMTTIDEFRVRNGIQYERSILLVVAVLYIIYALVESLISTPPAEITFFRCLAATASLVIYSISYTDMYKTWHDNIMLVTIISNTFFSLAVWTIRTTHISPETMPDVGICAILIATYTIPIKLRTAFVAGTVSSLMFVSIPVLYSFINEACYTITAMFSLNALLILNAFNNIETQKKILVLETEIESKNK